MDSEQAPGEQQFIDAIELHERDILRIKGEVMSMWRDINGMKIRMTLIDKLLASNTKAL